MPIDGGDTAWMLVATGFVLLCVPHPRCAAQFADRPLKALFFVNDIPGRAVPRMTPGLAFFEAGLLRSRNSISILMQCWAGLCILSVLWYALPPSADRA